MKKIPFSKVVCDGKELAYVREVIESGWLTTASKAMEFERLFGERVGGRFSCAVNSCTAALHLALEALGIGPGDTVLVPTWTFTATAEVIRYLGADALVVDVDRRTGLITPEIIEHAIVTHPGVKAVMVVHFAGQAARMTGAGGILEVCRRHGVRVVEDAAHAFPARLDGRMIGSFGDVTCFSFYANKTITTGEGGMIVTESEAVYRRVKLMRLHGIDRDVWNRFRSDKPSWEYDVAAPGFKYNMPDVNAAIGLAQLERADELRNQRQRCVEFYQRELAGLECLELPQINVPAESHAWHLYWVVLKPEAPLARDRFIEALAERGVGTSVHYKPLHRMNYYRERYQLDPGSFPQAEHIWRGCVSLPLYPSLNDEDLAYVVQMIREVLRPPSG